MFTKQACFLIDDDEDDREIFALALQSANKAYTCVTAKSGPDALAIFNKDPDFIPDFIFLDLNMPFMPGRECLQHIKNNPLITHIPVIVYTTSSYHKDVEETKLLGASHFLVKPPGMGLLTKALTRILDSSALPYYLESID